MVRLAEFVADGSAEIVVIARGGSLGTSDDGTLLR
jgi:hypothetical protein